ncbi:MAG: hypothetical protein ABIO86_11795 [Sphingomonas sp.]
MKTLHPLLVVVFFASVMIDAPAHAGDGSCPWNHLPEPVRASAMEAGLAGGPGALSNKIPAADLSRAEKACGLKLDNGGALRRAESGYMLQILAEAWLQKNATLSPQRLGAAWAAMGADAKAPFLRWAITLESDPEGRNQAYGAFLKGLGDRAGSLPPDAKPKIVTYLQGRSLRSVFEPRF